MADEFAVVIKADFWLNEQDSHEPTGIMFDSGDGPEDFAEFLRKRFGVARRGYEGDSPEDVPERPKVQLIISIRQG